ncbi:sugar phosphate isomerase/epimerase family protein [Pseudofrankia asymbiotica]|uniref:Xylose isomerase-like TIM barrel domain-containing protein n=1 Tax=Pseudofrankia asymbiotica TaxID=1834516 RepID=A0A1V2I7R9_9ACTN|nr:sugar phosphate isomerase/epimerase [Pseudofrankia asymbiotica]ONH27999.1 hypothetical protein BL253_20555 [Pseudofrankia asymbiotica]
MTNTRAATAATPTAEAGESPAGPVGLDLVACHHTLSGVGVAEPARFSFADRVAVASAAGFGGIGLTWLDYEHLLARGHSPAGLRTLADDSGVRVVEVEFLNAWWADGERRAEAERHERLVLDMAAAFGARHVGVGASVSPEAAPPHDLLVERFAALCDRAADHGLLVGLEFMPFFVLSDARRAWRVVADAGRPNGGVTVDAFHVGRGTTDLVMLGEIPAERIVALQLCDVAADPAWPVLEETLGHRLWPGQGALDLAGLVDCLLRPGAAFPVEVEVLNAAYREDSLPVNAHRAARCARSVLAEAAGRGAGG